ncbi:hypothetical protein [Pseudoduganella umbonata]|uniref:Uncharacterized protein n=1 Tax=Pseudoduganella umbonata TaxID=864828 RepID=A0A4P8HML4_9BURK|nr:hypothetical protein [Pseudoduganella umbonata]MBB3219532.1 hypothetical protein [Pseudoduganella umbonata]QCP09608.1 hypothetical protein FCL38_03610 [Pseudoduganella umbonata]
MEWIPIVFATFKILVLGTGMYYAVKWHYDQGRKKRDKEQGGETNEAQEKRAVLIAAVKVAAVFLLALLLLGLFTIALTRWVGLDLTFT